MKEELQFKMELITPLFLGGAQPRPTEDSRDAPHEWADLRVPSIRGALRYWLRAAFGGTRNGQNFAKLLEEESSVFGNTSRGSAVVVKAKWLNEAPEPVAFNSASFEGNVDLQIERKSRASGRNYLLWSMNRFGRDQPRQYFDTGNQIEIVLALRPVSHPDFTRLRKAAAAFWLFANLGGLGSRSRRCAGSLGFLEDYKIEGLPDFGLANDPADLAKKLADGVAKASKIFGDPFDQFSTTQQTAFDILHPTTCKIYVLHGQSAWQSWQEAMEYVGAYFSNFRYKRPPDDPNVREWIVNHQPMQQAQTVERSVFGLPLPFRYGQGRDTPHDVVIGVEHERRASPLHLCITKLQSGEHVGVAIWFNAKLLPLGERLTLQRDRRAGRVPVPSSLQLIDSLFTTNPYKTINIIPVTL